jgi:hypothetical protein
MPLGEPWSGKPAVSMLSRSELLEANIIMVSPTAEAVFRWPKRPKKFYAVPVT